MINGKYNVKIKELQDKYTFKIFCSYDDAVIKQEIADLQEDVAEINTALEDYVTEETFTNSQNEQDARINELEALKNLMPKTSGTGESISLNNTGEMTFYKFDLKGNTGQASTPTPDSPVDINVVSGDNTIEICGKNLINIQGIVKGRLDNGVIGYVSNTTALTLNQDSFSFTTNANYRGVTTDFIKVSSGTYMLSTDNLNSTYQTKFACYDGSKTWLQDATFTANASEKKITATIPSGTEYLRIYFALPSSGTITITNPQLEQGSTATTYETYTGQILPLNLPAENLFNKNTEIDNYYIAENGTITASNGFAYSTLIPVLQTTYTLSGTNGASTSSNKRVHGYDANGNWVAQIGYVGANSNAKYNYTFTISNPNIKSIRISILVNDIDVMLSKGSLPNTYTPYGTTPIEMCKIGDYQDTFIYTDKWYLHKEIGSITLNGSEQWSRQTTSTGYRYSHTDTTILPNVNNGAIAKLISNYFSAITPNQSYSSTTGISNNTSVELFICYESESTSTLADFKSWLSNNPTTTYYVLKTPTGIEITDTTLISQLNAIKNAMSKQGQTNISQVNNDKPFILDVTAFKDISNL